jgi:predicted acyl esterase
MATGGGIMAKATGLRRPKAKAKDGSWSEVRDGMRIDWDVPIEMDDGLVLRANVYRPVKAGKYPVVLAHGPYAKDLAIQDGYPSVWENFSGAHPEAIEGSSNIHQSWEVVDPEQWVPDGYACVRVDSRGAGRSPGYIDHWSPRETKDFHDCIEWAGVQDWSNGKVGLAGISYYAVNQWQVAAMRPPHLAAMCVWEGFSDFYRELSHPGGIYTGFLANWYDLQIKTVQHGVGKRGNNSRVHGELAAGPVTLSEKQLERNRADLGRDYFSRPLASDPFYTDRTADLSKIEVPLLSCASWAGQPLHPRGNYVGYLKAGSKQKWLECHNLEHWTHFYTPYGRDLQKQFFGYFLKGEKNGWDRKPNVMLNVRRPGEHVTPRGENEWPLKRTKWTKFHLDPAGMTLGKAKPKTNGKISYKGMGSDGVTFMMPPMDADTELCGPIAAKLFVSSDTVDADMFLVLRMFTPDLTEVTFKGTVDPHTPIAQGWLRASHRKLDRKQSKPYWPWHTHDEVQPLKPGAVYELDIDLHPTGVVVPAGYRLALTVRGKDYVWPGAKTQDDQFTLSNFAKPLTGCGPFLHDDPRDRPKKVFDNNVTLHTGPARAAYLMLPVIPPKSK